MDEIQETNELDLQRILFIFRKRFKWLLSGLIIGLVALFLLSEFVLPKKYTSSVSLYVYGSTQAASDKTTAANTVDLDFSQELVNTYIVVLEDDHILQQVADKLSQKISVEQLKKCVTMSAVNKTEVLSIEAETTDPNFSAEICNTFADVAPDVLKRVVKAGSVEAIGKAQPASKQSSPNVLKNSVIGALVGFLLMIFAALLVEMLDKTIKGEEDLKKRLDVPVLGEIPHMEQHRGGKGNANREEK